jgi:hypothetical protein
MKNFLIYYVFIALSIIVNSCSEEGFEDSKIFIALKEVTAITTRTTDTTPDYTFSSTESGTITYSGSCSSSTASATSGNNTITLSSLSDGTYADCTIAVSKTINIENSETIISDSLTITSFTVYSLSAPDNLSASGANNTIILTWNSVSGATSYTLYWDNVSGIDNSDTAITSININTDNTTHDNYTHSNMDNGSMYYYKVAAVDSSGKGTLSSVASAILASNIQASKTFNDHTYALTSAAMTWAQAKDNATALGGYLATLNTKAENVWIWNQFETQVWIGANDIDTEGTWVWDNGTTSDDGGISDNISAGAKWPDGTVKWKPGEPSNGLGVEDCALIRDSSGVWNDVRCNNNSVKKNGIFEFN